MAEKLFIAVLYTAVLSDKFMSVKITYFVHETTMDNEKKFRLVGLMLDFLIWAESNQSS